MKAQGPLADGLARLQQQKMPNVRTAGIGLLVLLGLVAAAACSSTSGASRFPAVPENAKNPIVLGVEGATVEQVTKVAIRVVSDQGITMIDNDTSFHGLANYAALFGDARLWESLLHTLSFTAIALPLESAATCGRKASPELSVSISSAVPQPVPAKYRFAQMLSRVPSD